MTQQCSRLYQPLQRLAVTASACPADSPKLFQRMFWGLKGGDRKETKMEQSQAGGDCHAVWQGLASHRWKLAGLDILPRGLHTGVHQEAAALFGCEGYVWLQIDAEGNHVGKQRC